MSEFRNEQRAKQLIDFSNLSFKNGGSKPIRPTDLDFLLNVGGRAIIVGEFKCNNAPHDLNSKTGIPWG